jgi:long-chain acyl-CoA synthetase
MSIIDGLKRAIGSNPDKPSVVCGEIRLNFVQLGERVNRLSSALARLGIQKSDRVAVLSLNCHRFLELYYSIPQLGAVVVPINFRIPPQEMKYIIEHSGARAVAVEPTFLPQLEEVRSELSFVDHFIAMTDQPQSGYLVYEELLESGSANFAAPVVEGHELLALFYTSGTTGEPKGVMLTHRNLESNIEHSDPVYESSADDIYLHAAPMFHLADGAAVFSNTGRGSTQIFIPRFEPTAVLQAIAAEKVTSVILVPTMINFLLQQADIDSYDLSSLRLIIYGASPIAPDLLRRAMQKFQCRFAQGYGLTEASPLLTVLNADDHIVEDETFVKRLASCGKPVPGVEVRVINERGAEVAPGEVGEIVARGENIMAGYWRRPEDTQLAIRDGWLYTGDLATVDKDGYLYLVDRRKDMIVTGGENVFSTEVEAALYAHPHIKEAAVIPIPDSNWGEAVHACVTLVDGSRVSSDELIEFCRSRLANYKLPRSIEFLEGELPKGGTGKILKKQLRDKYWQGRTRRIG